MHPRERVIRMKLDNSLRGSLAMGSGVPMPGMVQYIPPKVAEVHRDVLRNFPHSKRVGNYLLGRTLGEGSFAKVKEALHILSGEKVAVKVIDKKKAKEDAYVRKNMRREGKLLQLVRHKNVVRLYEIMETENSYYLVTELCRGGDLMDHICNKRKLDERETRRNIRQMISAVDYLHKAGILHRDLKVENLLLDENRDIKLIDFGLSNAVRVSHTKEGSVAQEFCVTQCGSPAYAAPELLGNKKYGPKVDIWSIGVNMFAMLTGNLPFTVEPFNIKSLHNKMLKGEMNAIPEHLSRQCKDLLKRFLTADPDQRITLQEAMQHPWIMEGNNKPLEPAPFPNRNSADDLDQNIVKHMAHNMEFRLSEVIRLVTNNVPSSCTSTYNLLQRKLVRYNAELRVQGKVSASGVQLLSMSSTSSQQTASGVGAGTDREVAEKTSHHNEAKTPASTEASNKVADRKNNNEEGGDDEDVVIELSATSKTSPNRVNLVRKPDSVPENETIQEHAQTDANGNVDNSDDVPIEAQTSRKHRLNDDRIGENVQLFRMPATNTTANSVIQGIDKTQPEFIHGVNGCSDQSRPREDPYVIATVPKDLPAISHRHSICEVEPVETIRQVNSSMDTHGDQRGRRDSRETRFSFRQPGVRPFAPPKLDNQTSSQSTTSSNGRRSACSGPGGATNKVAPTSDDLKTATFSDPSTRQERRNVRNGSPSKSNSPKRYVIDTGHYERFARKGGVRVFPSVESLDRHHSTGGHARKVISLVYPNYNRGKAYTARQFIQRNARTLNQTQTRDPVERTGEHGRTGRMTGLVRSSLDSAPLSPPARVSEPMAADDSILEVKIGECRTAMERGDPRERRESYHGVGYSVRSPRVELPSISPPPLKGKGPH